MENPIYGWWKNRCPYGLETTIWGYSSFMYMYTYLNVYMCMYWYMYILGDRKPLVMQFFFLTLCGMRWDGVGQWRSIAHAHIRHATLEADWPPAVRGCWCSVRTLLAIALHQHVQKNMLKTTAQAVRKALHGKNGRNFDWQAWESD